MSNAFGLSDDFLAPAAFDQDVPGVDVVARHAGDRPQLSVDVLRLIGALHRRLWAKRSDVFDSTHALTLVDDEGQDATVVDHVVDLRNLQSWSDRLDAAASLREDFDEGRVGLHIRNLEELETAVLVDGRAVPAAIVDLSMAISAFSADLRGGHRRLSISYPMPTRSGEDQLWADLFLLAQDRAGIDRGDLIVTTGPIGMDAEVAAVA